MHTIGKVKFLSKNSILTTPQHFHEFLTIFLVKSKLSTAKKPKTTTFSVFTSFFTQKKIDNFLGKSKLNFWTKNVDFEQCDQFIQFCLLFCPYLQFFDNKIIKIPGEKSQLFFVQLFPGIPNNLRNHDLAKFTSKIKI